MKSNSRVLRGWRDFGVKATAIILTILLATQMVGTPAFASGALTNKQASEDIAATVDDTGVEPSGTEATDTTVPDEAAGAANEPAPADSTQATEEPVVETVESATEPATETPAADPAANTVLGTEPEPTADSGSEPAPAVEQNQLASIKLILADGTSITLSKDGNKIDDDTNPVDVPANEELKFTAAAPEGMQISAVKTFINGVESDPIAADENGEYTIAAEDVTDGLTVKVETSAVEGGTPSEGEEASTENAAEAGNEESTDPAAAEGESAIEESVTPESIANTATSTVKTMVSEISLFAAGDESGTVLVTVKKTNDSNYSQKVNLPLGSITSESATTAVADLGDLESYEYRDARVDNVEVISINQHGDTYYVTTGENQIAGIALDDTTDVVLYFQPEGSTYQVNYKVMLGNEEVTGDNIPGDLIGPETVNKGEDFSMSFVPDEGYNVNSVQASDSLNVSRSDNVYTIENVQSDDASVDLTIYVSEITEYNFTFSESSNTQITFNGQDYVSGTSDNHYQTHNLRYTASGSLTFAVRAYNEWDTNSKTFNKLVLTIDGVSRSISIPAGSQNQATTEFGDGISVIVSRAGYGSEYTVTIQASNGKKVRGDISISTNFKKSSSSEIWATELIGVEPLKLSINLSEDGNKDGLMDPREYDWAERNTNRSTQIYIKVSDGYDADTAPVLTLLMDGDDVSNQYSLREASYSYNGVEYDYVLTIPADSRKFNPKDIRIGLEAKSLERSYGARFEGEGYQSQTKSGTWSSGEIFSVSDDSGVVPERGGFVFQGWKLEGDSSGTVYKNGVPFSINDDVINYVERGENGVYYFTFVAQWVEADEADQVPYNINLYFANEDGEYGEEPSRTIQENGVPNKTAFIDADTLTQTLTELGYIPDGDWIADDSKNDYSVYVTADEVASIKIYYQRAVSVTFEPGGEGAASDQQSETVKIAINTSLNDFGETVPEFAAAEGWAFDGWRMEDDDELLSSNDVASTKIMGDTTFTAQWVEKEGTFRYHLVLPGAQWSDGAPAGFVQDGASEAGGKFWVDPAKYRHPDTITVTDKVPTCDGYVFLGWFDKARTTSDHGGTEAAVRNADDTFTYLYDENSDDNVYTLDALWASIKAEPKTVTYDGDEHGIDAATVEYNNKSLEEFGAGDLIKLVFLQYSETEGGGYSDTIPAKTNAGKYTIYVKATLDVDGKEVELKTSTTLEIAKRNVEFTGESGTRTYTGSAIKLTGVTTNSGEESGLVNGHAHNVVALAEGTDAGRYEGSITLRNEVKITDANNKDVTANYEIITTPGWLEIEPVKDEVTVTITGNSGTVTYNGSVQEVTGFTYAAAKGEDALSNSLFEVALADGSQAKASGTDAGTYNMGLDKDDFVVTSANYSNVKVEVVDGWLEIEPVKDEVTVTITGNSGTVTYNGSVQEVTGFTYAAAKGEDALSNSLFEVALADGSQAKASGTDAGTYNMGLDKDDFVVTSANYSNVKVEVVDGWLEIEPVKDEVTVTITGNSGTVTYNGSVQEVTGFTYAAAKGEDALSNSLFEVALADGSQAKASGTDAGTYNMGLDKDDFVVTSANYSNVKVEVVDGWLEIEPVKDEVTVTITGNSGTVTYNGSVQEVTGFTYAAAKGEDALSNSLFEVALADGSQAKASGTDAGTYNMGLDKDDFVVTSANYSNVKVEVVDGWLEIEPVKDEVTVTITGNSGTVTYNGSVQEVTGFTYAAAKGEDALSNSLFEVALADGSQAKASGTDAGTYNMGLDKDDFVVTSANYSNVKVEVVDGWLEIEPVKDEVTVTITGNSGTVTYNGSVQEVTGFTYAAAKGEDALSNSLFEVALADGSQAKASGTDAGTYNMGLDKDDFVVTSANYSNVKVEVVDGWLEIEPVKDEVTVTITGNSGTVTYNGSVQEVTGFTYAAAKGEDALSNSLFEVALADGSQAKASGTDAGTYNMGLDKDDFVVTSANYSNVKVEVVDGWLEIEPVKDEVTVTITGNSGTVTYNGSVQEVTGFTYAAAKGEDALSNSLFEVALADGSQAKASGTDAGTYNMGLDKDDFVVTSANYSNVKVEVVDGWLEIEPVKDEVTVTITGNSGTVTYNGSVQEVTGFTYAAAKGEDALSNSLFEVALADGSQAKASGTDAGTYNMGLDKDDFVVTSANYSNVKVEVVDGWLEIEPVKDEVTVTITGNSGTVTYNGSVQEVTGFTYAAAKGEDALSNSLFEVALADGSQAKASGTDAGTYNMGLDKDDFVVTSANYSNVKVEVVDGWLEIEPVKDEVTVTITGNSGSFVFDGNEHTVEGYVIDIPDNVLVKESDIVFSGEASVSRTDVGFEKMGLSSDDFVSINTNYSNVKFVVVDGGIEITQQTINPEDPDNPDSYLDVRVSEPADVTYNGQHQESPVTVTRVDEDGKVVATLDEVVDYTLTYDNDVNAGEDTASVTVKGIGNYTGSVTKHYTISPAAALITVNDASKVYGDDDPVFTGAITLADGKSPLYTNVLTDSLDTLGDVTYSRDNANVEDAGAYPEVLNAQVANLNSNYTYKVQKGDFTITEADGNVVTITTAAEDRTKVYDGKAITIDAQASAAGSTLLYSTDGQNWSETKPTLTDVGSLTIYVKATNPNYEDSPVVDANVQVTPTTLRVTTPSDTKIFDGTPLAAEGSISGFVEVDGVAETATFETTGSQTEVGESANTYKITWDGTAKESNYTVVEDLGTLLVYPQSIDPEDPDPENPDPDDPSPDDPDPENPDQPFYNGVKVTGPEDVDYNGLSQQLPPTVTDRNDNPLDPNYYDVAYSDDTVNAGTVTITVTGKNGYTGEVQVTYQIKKVGLTITTPDAGKVYDGMPLQNQIVQADGWKDNDASQVTLTANGSITEVGSTLNTYVATDPDNVLRNYNITEDLGTLTVWPQSIDPEDPDPDNPDPDDPDPTDPDPGYDPDDPDPEDPDQPFYTGIKIQGPDPQMYDAADQTPGVVVTDKNGKVLEEGTDYRITGYDNNYNVTTEDSPAIIHVEGMGNYGGSIDVEFEIIPAPLTVTTPSAGKVYDGSALTAGPADVEGLQGSDATAVTITANGTQTDVGNSVNGVSYDWGQVLASNYSITEDLGTLTVWPQSIDPTDPGENPDPDDPDAPDPSDPDPDFPGEDPDPDNPVVPDQPFYTGAEVNAPQDVSYNGTDQTWVPTVTDAEDNLLTAGEDYEVSYSTNDRTNVTGDITVTITGKGNYAGTITREYQITPLEIDVYIENQTKVEGEADPTFTFNYEGVLEGESMGWTGAFVRDAGEAAGTYNVAQGGFVLADNEAGNFLASNYTLTVHPGTLTITAAPVPPGPDDPDPVTPVTPLPTPDPTPVPTPAPGDEGATPVEDTTDEAEEAIDDEATPLTAPEPIDDNVTPMASGAHRDCWVHWLMLLGILVTVVYYGGVGVRRVRFSSSLQSFEDDVLGNDETNR